MSSPNPPNNNSSETSYLQMASTTLASRGTDPDAALVGSHCAYTYCNQLDFLPFKCQSCIQTYCLDHRTEDSHSCPKKGVWAEHKRQQELAKHSAGQHKQMREYISQKPCADDTCSKQIGTSLVPGVHCDHCNRDYCLKHRLREDHDCKNKPPIGARQKTTAAATTAATNLADKTLSAFERFKLWGASKKEEMAKKQAAKKPQSKAAQIIAVNTLKKTAKGDAKIPPEKRVYIYVEAESETAKAKIPKGEFFYNKDWVVGRLLDAAAQALQVQNINNRSNNEEDRLRVFHVEGGRLLDFGEKIGTALQSGNTVVLLRGVGAPADLITL
ncbi:AN1-type zinc finger protein 1 [Podospora fimiseda]|uniref:AN1-type zinc finger protein 1 n=1 Tax=Podospora fimiseda TaxID=252190 RepID=A0AAN7GX57_9PEZI|nr:AN1-type zinc finger protein 1 [Podospora fimiseda]